MIGSKFGRLEVKSRAGRTKENRATWWCKCKCGNMVEIVGKFLRDGRTQSCGCKRLDAITKHGDRTRRKRSTPEYETWCSIKSRCYNPNHVSFYLYGGKGISVCESWRDSFVIFLHDMGRKPTLDYTIERLNSNGDYKLDNCVWATRLTQANNQSNNRRLEINGQTKTLAEWCRHFDVVGNKTAGVRINKLGWDILKAVSTPPIKRKI